MSAADDTAVSVAEARALFADLTDVPSLVLAISGGPDSTALLLLAARWRKSLKAGPKLVAVTVDHGLRPEAKREAAAVKKLARSLGVEHRTMRWTGRKPSTGLQQAARNARYGLLAAAAKSAGARHILTAHTMDDQAETVLIRLARGSGVSGLAAMARLAPLPQTSRERIGRSLSEDALIQGLIIVRPFLLVPKNRLLPRIAELAESKTFEEVIPISALTGDGLDRLRTLLYANVPEGDELYPVETVTMTAPKVHYAEVIREKFLHRTREEIPYGVGVVVEEIREEPAKNLVVLSATIVVDKENHKGIVLGRGGTLLRDAATEARHELEKQFKKRFYLELNVAARPGWREDPRFLIGLTS